MASGRQEIQLLGQIVNHYQAPDDPACDFAQLLAEVNDVPGVERIRFASPHPRHTGARLIEAVRDLPKVCKHLHLPVQSGSTRVLEAMRRRHTREEYLDLVGAHPRDDPGRHAVDRHDRRLPGRDGGGLRGDAVADRGGAVPQHVLVQVLGPAEHARVEAACRTTCSEAEKTARIVALQALQREIQTRLHEAAVGTVVDVLVDSVSRRRDGEISRAGPTGNTVVTFPVPTDTCRAAHVRWRGWGGRYRCASCAPARTAWLAKRYVKPAGIVPADPSTPMLIEMTIKGLMVDPITNMPIVILKDKDGDRVLPIWVGIFEANAIALQIENIATPRPMTHDLLRNVITDLDGQVDRVVVCDLKDNTFYAVIHLTVRGERVAVDARPSDAIALALRTRSPILVEETVIDNAKTVDFTSERADNDRLQKWLESLDPDELGKYKM